MKQGPGNRRHVTAAAGQAPVFFGDEIYTVKYLRVTSASQGHDLSRTVRHLLPFGPSLMPSLQKPPTQNKSEGKKKEKEMFNPLTTTAAHLAHLLDTNQLTTTELVGIYLDQIEKYEPTLNAFISLAPRDKLFRAARKLDDERRRGEARGRLHGIPIVLKVFPSPFSFLCICGLSVWWLVADA